MYHILNYIEKKSGKKILSFSFVLIFSYLVGISPYNSYNLFIEKTVETEKETRTENENIDEEDSEVGSSHKIKKYKKILDKDWQIHSISAINRIFCFSSVIYQSNIADTPQYSSCPFYIAYHQLVFYEI